MDGQKAMLLQKVLAEDLEWASRLFELDAEAAAEELKKKGYTFTVEELYEVGEAVSVISEQKKQNGADEFTEESLKSVVGGGSAARLAAVWVLAAFLATNQLVPVHPWRPIPRGRRR